MYLILTAHTRRQFFNITGGTETLYELYTSENMTEVVEYLQRLHRRGVDPRKIKIYPSKDEEYLKHKMTRI